jgi:two-component system NtrC family sensor kinase
MRPLHTDSTALRPRFWPSLPLRAVIGASVVLGIVLGSALAYFDAASRFRQQYAVEMQLELEHVSTLTALALRDPLWNIASKTANAFVEAAFVKPEMRSIVVTNAQGQIFASHELAATESASDPSELISMTRDIVRDGEVLGQLTVAMSTSGYRIKLADATQRYARAGFLTTLVALLFILIVMQWRFIRPVNQLVNASKRLASGELHEPILATHHDELGSLANSLEETRKSLLDLFGKVEQRNAALNEANELLEQRVTERTQSLGEAMATLSRAQQEIIDVEKLASLGRVVAGVAHELNTPLGNALTVASTIADLHTQLRADEASGQLKRSTLQDMLERSHAGFDLLLRSLDRASSIVRDFKQVSVDQTSDQRRSFDLADVSNEVLTLLNPILRKTNCRVDIQAEAGLLCDSFPGSYGQVLTNLINNANLHGLAEQSGGTIYVTLSRVDEGHLRLVVRDEGIGMTEEVRKKIFDPFFTTKMGRGGSGLGMNIVQGIVIRIMGGVVVVNSAPGKGATIVVTFPTVAPHLSDKPLHGAGA